MVATAKHGDLAWVWINVQSFAPQRVQICVGRECAFSPRDDVSVGSADFDVATLRVSIPNGRVAGWRDWRGTVGFGASCRSESGSVVLRTTAALVDSSVAASGNDRRGYGVFGTDSGGPHLAAAGSRVAQRALAVLFLSTAPNSIVIDVDVTDSRLLFHQLTGTPLPILIRKLEE